MYTLFFFLLFFFFFLPSIPSRKQILHSAACIVTAPKSPWQQTCATAYPSLLPPPSFPPSTSGWLSSQWGSGANVLHLPPWSTEADAGKRRNDIVHINPQMKKKNSLVRWLLLETAWGHRMRSKESDMRLESGGVPYSERPVQSVWSTELNPV